MLAKIGPCGNKSLLGMTMEHDCMCNAAVCMQTEGRGKGKIHPRCTLKRFKLRRPYGRFHNVRIVLIMLMVDTF